MRKQLHIILRLVMFCCILLFVSQEVSAQITFSVKNQTIRQTIRVIEKKADYSFFYTDKLPGLDQKISLKVDNESIDSVWFFVKFGGNLFFISTVFLFFFLNPIKSCRYVCFLVTLKTPHH